MRFMNRRRLVTFLLIAGLLGCPYVCLSETPGIQRGGEPGCSCTGCGCLPSPDDSRPGSGLPLSEPKSCLCAGAVFEASPRESDSDSGDEGFFLWAAVQDPAAARAPALAGGPDVVLSKHPWPTSSGRDLRALFASFLL
jgi:hypothetical protein